MALGQKPSNRECLDLLKFHQTSRGDAYLILLPKLFKPTGLHFSFHASGKWHIGTEKPEYNVNLPNMDELATYFQEKTIPTLETTIRPPRQGYQALILILPNPKNFVVEPIRKRYIMDVAALFDASTIAAIDDTSNLAPALQQLKANGYINENAAVTIMTESGEISIYRSSNIVSKLDHVPNSGWLHEVEKYQGFITTFETPRNGELPRALEIAFRPLFKPIRELMDTLFASNVQIRQSIKIEEFKHIIEKLGKRIKKKEPILIN